MKADLILKEEIMRMSGPWTARVLINNTIELENDFIYQDPIFDYSKNLLFLVMPIHYTSCLIKKIKFSIFVYDDLNKKKYISKATFNYLFIEKYDNNVLTFYESFNNADLSKRNEMIFNLDNFNVSV